MSIVRGNCVRETSVKRQNKIVQEITWNVANVFQFLCNNSDRKCFFNALAFARSLGRCWKPWPSASVFNTYQGTWRMLMHEKTYLIPILINIFLHITNLTGHGQLIDMDLVMLVPPELLSTPMYPRTNTLKTLSIEKRKHLEMKQHEFVYKICYSQGKIT